MKKRKRKLTFKKIKKIFALLGSEIKNWFVNLHKKFLLLSKKVQIIIKIWAVVFLIIIVLVIGSIINNNHVNKYKEFEEIIANATYTYYNKEDLHASEGQPEKVDLIYLIDQGYIDNDEISSKKCTGFGYIYDSEETGDYVTKGYINCKHYTTEGYTKIK